MDPIRVVVGIDYGTTWSAAVVAVVGQSESDGATDTPVAIPLMHPVKWRPEAAGTAGPEALEMVFRKEPKLTNPDGWQADLPVDSRTVSDKTRLIKYGLEDLTKSLQDRNNTVNAIDFVDEDESNEQLDAILNTSTEELLSKAWRNNSEPELWLRKSMETMWNRFIRPLIDLKTGACSEIIIDVAIGVPAVWSTSQALKYGHSLRKGIPSEHLRHVWLINEAQSVLLGRIVETTLDLGEFQPNCNYTMFDAGGGTVDIATFTTGEIKDFTPELSSKGLYPSFEHLHESASSGLCKHHNNPKTCGDCQHLNDSKLSDWFGFETVMNRFKALLEEPLHELLPSVTFDNLDLEDTLPEMMQSLRRQLHDYSPDGECDRDAYIRLHDRRFIVPDYESSPMYTGLLFSELHRGILIIEAPIVRRAFDMSVAPAVKLLSDRLEWCASAKLTNHKVLVTGGFAQNQYLRSQIQAAVKALGPAAVPVLFEEGGYNKLTLARGAAYFAQNSYIRALQADTSVVLGIVTHVDTSKEEAAYRDALANGEVKERDRPLPNSMFAWNHGYPTISSQQCLTFIKDDHIDLLIAWAEIEPEVAGYSSCEPQVRYSDIEHNIELLRPAGLLYLPLSKSVREILSTMEQYKTGDKPVLFNVKLVWWRTMILCVVYLPLPGREILIGNMTFDMLEYYRPPGRINNLEPVIRITAKLHGINSSENNMPLVFTHRPRQDIAEAGNGIILDEDKTDSDRMDIS